MAGAWKGGLSFANATSIGAVNSNGTLLTGSASTYTKGAWGQLTASTTTDINWLLVQGVSFGWFGRAIALDIGVGGAGSEVIVVANLNYSDLNAVTALYMLPVSIPAGSRIAGRFASNSANDFFNLLVTGFQDTYQSAGTAGSIVDTYGFSTSTNFGTQIDPGSTPNTKGAYVQLTASTTADILGVMLRLDGQGTTTGTTGGLVSWLVDLAVGAAASEIVILPNMFNISYTATSTILNCHNQHFIPLQIAAGSRIAVRAQCSTGTSPDRLIGATVYGVRY